MENFCYDVVKNPEFLADEFNMKLVKYDINKGEETEEKP